MKIAFRVLIVAAASGLGGLFYGTPGNAQTGGGYPIEIVPVTPHATAVMSAVLSPDGRLVLSGSSDGTMKLWDAATGRLIRTFEGHNGAVDAVLFTRDGKRAISASNDKTIKLWDLASGRVLRTFEGHTGEVKSIALSRDGGSVLSASFDKTLRLWDLASGRLLRTFNGHAAGVSSVAISPDGRFAIASDQAATIRLWDIATAQTVRTFKAPPLSGIISVTFSPDGATFMSSGFDKTMRLWDVASDRLLRTFTGHADAVLTAAFSPDGARVVSGGFGTDLRLWDVATGRLINSFTFTQRPFWSLAWTPDGKKVLAGAASAMLLDPVSGQPTLEFKGSSSLVASVAMLPDGTRAVAGGGETTLKLWDLRNGRLLNSMGDTPRVKSIAVTLDGATVLSGSSDGQFRLFDIATAQRLRTFEGQVGLTGGAALSRDGKLAAGGGSDKAIKLWDVATGRVLRTLTGSPHGIGSVAFSPDGRQLASGSYDIRVIPQGFDSTLKTWDVASGRLLRTLSGHVNQIRSVVFSADGSRIVTGSSDSTIKLWDAASGKVLRTFTGHAASVNAVAISADGSRLLSGSFDRTIRLWDVASGNVIRTFTGHTAGVDSVAFSPDGKRILSGSDDTTMRVWDLERGNLQASFLSTADNEWLAITPEGFFAASDKGAGMLSVVRGLDVFSIDQFYQSLYRPDLVAEKLAGDPRGLVRAAADQLDLGKVLASGNAPLATFVSPANGGQVASSQINATVEIAGRDGGIGRVEWRVNGVTRGVETPAAPPAGQPLRLTRGLALDAGNNTVEVVAYNSANLIASVPARVSVVAPAAQATAPGAPAPRLFVLAAGSDQYADARFRLAFSVADASAMGKALTDAGKGLYRSVEVKLMRDTDVTRDKLDAAFAELAGKILPGDVFVLYLAGHGKTVNGRYYYIPQNFKIDGALTNPVIDAAVIAQGVSQEQWQRWFAQIPARKSLILFDTCESGTLTGAEIETKTLERGAANDRMAQASGRSIITASSGSTEAFEGYHGHGLFTYNLLDALDRGDGDGNGTIEVTELAAYVYSQVIATSEQVFNQRQEPQIKIAANYTLTRKTHVLPDTAPVVAMESKPTFQVAQTAQLVISPNSGATVVRSLSAKTPVSVLASKNGWSLIAAGGKPLGYVATRDLSPTQ